MSDWRIRPDDTDFRERVLGMMNPKTMLDYGSSVNIEDVARICPDIFAAYIAPWLPAGQEENKGDAR